MRIITRYVAREFTLNFLLGLGAFSATYLIVEFFERINAFVYNKAPWPLIGAYFLNKFPLMLFQVAPAAVLLASILTLGIMSRHNEVMAMKSGGVGLWSLAHPILGVVGMIFVVLLGMNEYVVPYANQNARMITNLVIHKKKATETFKQSQIWIHGQQTIYNVQLYHPERNLLEGVTLYRFSPQFELLERVDARSAQWKEGKWVLAEASVTDFAQQGVAVRKNYPELTLSLQETPADFQVAEKNPERDELPRAEGVCAEDRAGRLQREQVPDGHVRLYLLPVHQRHHGISWASPWLCGKSAERGWPWGSGTASCSVLSTWWCTHSSWSWERWEACPRSRPPGWGTSSSAWWERTCYFR